MKKRQNAASFGSGSLKPAFLRMFRLFDGLSRLLGNSALWSERGPGTGECPGKAGKEAHSSFEKETNRDKSTPVFKNVTKT
jgi:hypothetical protein